MKSSTEMPSTANTTFTMAPGHEFHTSGWTFSTYICIVNFFFVFGFSLFKNVVIHGILKRKLTDEIVKLYANYAQISKQHHSYGFLWQPCPLAFSSLQKKKTGNFRVLYFHALATGSNETSQIYLNSPSTSCGKASDICLSKKKKIVNAWHGKKRIAQFELYAQRDSCAFWRFFHFNFSIINQFITSF